MKEERVLLIFVAAAIFVTPSILTSPVLAQTDTGTQGGTTDGGTAEEGTTEGGTTGGGADDGSALYTEFQSCLEDAEGTEDFATEDEIRTCFIDVGYTGGGDDNEDDNDNDNEEEDEDDDEENN
jgi:hypothetical protein